MQYTAELDALQMQIPASSEEDETDRMVTLLKSMILTSSMTLEALHAIGLTNPIKAVQGGSEKLRQSLQDLQKKMTDMSQIQKTLEKEFKKEIDESSAVCEFVLTPFYGKCLSDMTDEMVNDIKDVMERCERPLPVNPLISLWLELTPEDADFEQTPPVPKDYFELLFLAHHDPAAITYRGVFYIVQQLTKAEPMHFTIVLYTLELAAFRMLRGARSMGSGVATDLRFLLLRILELLLYHADQNVDRKSQLTALLNLCKTSFPASTGSILVRGLEQFASDGLDAPKSGSASSPAYALHSQATKLDTVLPLPSTSKYILIADNDTILVLQKPVAKSSIRQIFRDGYGVRFAEDVSRLYLTVEEIGIRQVILPHEEDWYFRNFNEAFEELFNKTGS
jgi:hypothetical protein